MLHRAFRILLVLSLSYAGMASGAELRIRANTLLKSQSRITLGDLVENKADLGDSFSKLQTVVLGDAPKTGEKRVFSSHYISQILRANLGTEKLNVRIPSRVVVSRSGNEFNEANIEIKLKKQWKSVCNDCRFRISSIHLPKLNAALQGRPWNLEVKNGLPRGAFTEKVIIVDTENKKQTAWVTGQVEVQKKVPVATRSLNSNIKLEENDLRLEWRDITYASDSAYSLEDLVGQRLKFGIPANQVVWANSVAREKAVKRGDLVKVVSGEGNWQITLQAITEQDGYVGDRVNIRNMDSKKILSGEVVAPGQVVIK